MLHAKTLHIVRQVRISPSDFPYLCCLEDVKESLDRVAHHEDQDDAHKEGGHGGVATVGVPLRDGVVVGVGLEFFSTLLFKTWWLS